jgi:PAS domain-containing protein
MQEENTYPEITSTIATLRNFSPEKPVDNAVIYFWESHTNLDDKARVQATVELICKEFDLYTCEKYEVRTGYLNRYNYLSKPINECSSEEIEEAITKGRQEQNNWLNICKPELPEFKIKNWQECIFKEVNHYFEQCRYLVLETIKSNEEFKKAVLDSATGFADKHGTNVYNGNMYIIEDISWILSLPLLHPNKPIFLIHVGNDNSAIRALFHHFSDLKRRLKWISPNFSNRVFRNTADFLLNYTESRYGYSYAMENKELVKSINQFPKKRYTKENIVDMLNHANSERNLLLSIIAKIPGHVYWLSRDNIYLGCNDSQAEDFKLKSRDEIIGKTNEELLPLAEAQELNKINVSVMETEIPFEGEECASFIQNRYGNYLTHKTPLYDIHGKVIGLLGISIDITDRKRAEQLEIQNRLQKVELKEQQKFKKLAEQVSHTIFELRCRLWV